MSDAARSSQSVVDDVEELSADASSEEDRVVHSFELRIPGTLTYFKGHFEGEPILAAVVQLDVIILPRIERLWPDLGPMQKATKMKFRKPIGADDEVTLALSRREGKKCVDVTIFKADRECTSGSLFFQ